MSNKIKNENVNVDSSTIKSINYDYDSKILLIEFNGNAKYEYKDVPEGVYLRFKYSDSLGKHFNENIKDNYSFSKI